MAGSSLVLPPNTLGLRVKELSRPPGGHLLFTYASLTPYLEIQGKDITADALLTQRTFASSLVDDRHAHDHFTVKGNQPQLLQDIALYFKGRQAPDFVEATSLGPGRIETQKIWTTSALNAYLHFPHVRQAFGIERARSEKTTGKRSPDIASGITSRPPDQASAQQVLTTNRGHWSIEKSGHDILDWNFEEDRSRIRTGHGPENVSRLRRFAIGLIKAKGVSSVAQKMRQLHRHVRLVFDYLRMSKNSCARTFA